MIVDFHAHIFPPEICTDRAAYVAADRTFAEMYGSPKARLAGANDLLESMAGADVDVSCVQGFGWSDPEMCRRHNDYLLEAAAASGGRLRAFCAVQPTHELGCAEEAKRVKARDAAGLGELRPSSQGYDLEGSEGERLAELSVELGLPLLFHVTEPLGHQYPGKAGLEMGDFYRFARAHPECEIIGAHWGGGLPLYGLMPEVSVELGHVFYDTAASSLLYDDRVFTAAIGAVGGERILFGSDYPLLDQGKQIQRVRKLGLAAVDTERILGGNAAQLLRL